MHRGNKSCRETVLRREQNALQASPIHGLSAHMFIFFFSNAQKSCVSLYHIIRGKRSKEP
jgi:hypothetical protein